ncbi:MAG TPA: Rrf2 family transcriptional regulator [Sedimentisphaerales bacterium]|nr:Rrf2 family transcriptional regulator [Sedimentisphaerales bacterium]
MNIIRQNTDYALRVMVNLARNYNNKAVSAQVLAGQEDISYQFACKILQQLHKAGLVDSSMGPKGGFSLSRPPGRIGLLNVIEAVQGPLKLNKCLLGADACPRRPNCPVSVKLAQLQKYIEKYLRGTTLKEFSQGTGPTGKDKARNPNRRKI